MDALWAWTKKAWLWLLDRHRLVVMATWGGVSLILGFLRKDTGLFMWGAGLLLGLLMGDHKPRPRR